MTDTPLAREPQTRDEDTLILRPDDNGIDAALGLARLERADGPVSLGVLRKALRSDLRPEFQPAMDRLHDAGSVVETAHGYVGGGQPVHPVHPRSDAVIGCPPDPSTCPPDAD